MDENFDAIQELINEEATMYPPRRSKDVWDYLSLTCGRWLTRTHAPRVQRFHPEHRSRPEELSNLVFDHAGDGGIS